jgi:hypothetical protein
MPLYKAINCHAICCPLIDRGSDACHELACLNPSRLMSFGQPLEESCYGAYINYLGWHSWRVARPCVHNDMHKHLATECSISVTNFICFHPFVLLIVFKVRSYCMHVRLAISLRVGYICMYVWEGLIYILKCTCVYTNIYINKNTLTKVSKIRHPLLYCSH